MTNAERADKSRVNKAAVVRGGRLVSQIFWIALFVMSCLLTFGCGGAGESVSASRSAESSPQESVVGGDVNADNARVVNMRWLGSSSSGITRYDLLVGTSPGEYQARIEVPTDRAGFNGDGIYSHSLTLREDLDYYLAMQAYDGRLVSQPSNEIQLAATALPREEPAASVDKNTDASSPTGDASHGVASASRGGSRQAVAHASAGVNAAQQDADVTTTDAEGSDSRHDLGEELNSIEFSGKSDYIGSDAPEAVWSAETISLSLWMRPFLDAAPRRVLMEIAPSERDDVGLMISLIEGDQLEFLITDAEGQQIQRALYAFPVAYDLWQHLALVFDPSRQSAPQVYLDLFEADLLVSEGTGQFVDPRALSGFVRFGGTNRDEVSGYLGRLGHLGLWRGALSIESLSEIQGRGHQLDLRDSVGAYRASASLLHYWRLGEVNPALGYDLGFADRLIDLDDPTGGITPNDIVQDGPVSLIDR